MKVLRTALFVTAGLGGVLLVLVAVNLARLGDVHLVRFREATLAIESLLVLGMLLGRAPGARIDAWRARLGRVIGAPRFFGTGMAVMLALFLLATFTQHWAFRTGSHDFAMIDEALWQSHHGRFLWSPVLGRSFLSEHFSPVLALLVPLHALLPSPGLLLGLHALALWSGGLALAVLLRDHGVAPAVRHLATLVYLNHALTASTLGYPFHMECLLPPALFTLALAARRHAWPLYALALVVALSIKEDVGFYVAGFGGWLALAEKRWRLGLVTAGVSLAWSFAAVQLAIPAFAGPNAEYAFLGRWDRWGHGIGGILAGFAIHPVGVLAALFAKPYLAFFASLLLLPFVARWGIVLVLAPWVLNATSALDAQRTLSLYYGIPLLACAAIASAAALGERRGRWTASGRAAFGAAMLAVLLNVSHLSYPHVPCDRGEIVRHLRSIPASTPVQAMGCFFPWLGYEREKRLLRPGEPPTTSVVVLWTRRPTWPFTRAQAESLARASVESGAYRNTSAVPEFYVLERQGVLSP